MAFGDPSIKYQPTISMGGPRGAGPPSAWGLLIFEDPGVSYSRGVVCRTHWSQSAAMELIAGNGSYSGDTALRHLALPFQDWPAGRQAAPVKPKVASPGRPSRGLGGSFSGFLPRSYFGWIRIVPVKMLGGLLPPRTPHYGPPTP